MTDQPKYFHETARCPSCLRVGGLTVRYGYLICNQCDRHFDYSHVFHHNEAFDQGREFERKLSVNQKPKTTMPTRILTDHIANAVNDKLTVAVLDEPGAGGASHHYAIEIPGHNTADIKFQNGPIAEAGVNGVTQEALLAIVIDRLRSFQKGAFSCRENAIALTYCEDALLWLQKRTRDRMARGVEGLNKL